MTCFISGGAKNGKSSLAQNLAVALSEGGKHHFVATMISSGAEDDDRIRRHIADREGMGFETVECFTNVLSVLDTADPEGTFLVDSATALLQNAMFPVEKNYQLDLAAAQYSETTEMYRKCLAGIDRRLAAVCDTVIEAAGGNFIIHKGDLRI